MTRVGFLVGEGENMDFFSPAFFLSLSLSRDHGLFLCLADFSLILELAVSDSDVYDSRCGLHSCLCSCTFTVMSS